MAITAMHGCPRGGSRGLGTVRLYRTGDLSRRLREGVLEFLGRLDDHLKIRGLRAEAGEMGAARRGHDSVCDCSVLVRGDTLIAYIAHADPEPDTGALRAFPAERVPEHLVAGFWLPVAEIPLAVNGKVDREALAASGQSVTRIPVLPGSDRVRGQDEVLGVGSTGVDGAVKGHGIPETAGRMPAVGHGRACGTFGELLQGVLPEGDRDFLVTLPITEHSTARLTLTGERGPMLVYPPGKWKSHQLVVTMLASCGYQGGGMLELASRLPEGKGLASSSADLVATARAVADVMRLYLDGAAIEALLRQIEPSDGVMYDGVVCYYHRECRLREVLGCLPRLTIVAVDEGGQVDTVQHNRIRRPRNGQDKHEYAELLATLSAAVRTHDLAAVGAVATRSAQLSTKLRPRRHLEALQRITAEADALGLAAAHSGTMLGVLIAGHDLEHDAKVRQVTEACEQLAGSVSVFTSLCPHEECIPAEDATC